MHLASWARLYTPPARLDRRPRPLFSRDRVEAPARPAREVEAARQD